MINRIVNIKLERASPDHHPYWLSQWAVVSWVWHADTLRPIGCHIRWAQCVAPSERWFFDFNKCYRSISSDVSKCHYWRAQKDCPQQRSCRGNTFWSPGRSFFKPPYSRHDSEIRFIDAFCPRCTWRMFFDTNEKSESLSTIVTLGGERHHISFSALAFYRTRF